MYVANEMTESTQLQTSDNNNTSGANKMESPVSPTPSEQQYALKWNDFQTSILSSFRHLRDEEDFVDVTLACDSRSFTAHKVVLSACSPYFRKLLKANPCEHPIVILRDVKAEDMESLLRFMYNGEVHIGQEQLSDFLKTAQLLQVRGLADVQGPQPSARINSNAAAAAAAVAAAAASINSTSMSANTPAIQELKASPTSTSLPWELSDDRSNHLTPPPQKRIKSADLYRAQHGISPDRLADREIATLQRLTHGRDRDRSRDDSRERDRSLELRESLLGQALEGGPTLTVTNQQKHADLASLQAQSAGEDSNSSDMAASDAGDGPLDSPLDGLNGSMDHQRSASFSSAFLGLQGLPGLLPGPSGMHGSDSFVSRRSLEMRVRATDPRPCPKCGKIYRSAHTLRTHLEDKHTVCPGYRCVLCGTVAKSRNSLHSHMSRQHRGISTKDLPVLPMPSPFDPDLASRLLAKAGVKISPAELRARASPTSGTRRSDIKLELRGPGDEDDMDDPEDLTMGAGGHNNNNGGRYDGMIGELNFNQFNQNQEHKNYFRQQSGFNHPNTTITRVRHDALTPKSMLDSMSMKDGHGGGNGGGGGGQLPNAASSQSLLDTYLQFITENTFGMGMSQEHAAAAIHAAKMAQLNAMGHGLDKLPPGLLPPHLDLSKSNSQLSPNSSTGGDYNQQQRLQSTGSVTIEPTIQKVPTLSHIDRADIRRDSSEPMDLGLENNNPHAMGDRSLNDDRGGGNSSGEEGNYSEDEGVHNT